MKLITIAIPLLFSFACNANLLEVSKVCPVTNTQDEQLGILVLSEFWFHSGRQDASYIASDNATGIGVEIHFFNNRSGHLTNRNLGRCDKYRMLQVRSTNSLLNSGEWPIQVDIPAYFEQPFYDSLPLEFGYNTHLTPIDSTDKPWLSRVSRASTVGIYDTPYVSDAYGIEGEDIKVEFETCIVCQRHQGYDQLLSCATWGYQRDYLNEETGWTEPDIIPVNCRVNASKSFQKALENSTVVEYRYWLDWR